VLHAVQSQTGHDPALVISKSQRIEVVDCTLRDGEQAAGVWFTPEEKVELALLLDRAGVDVLDAGFPAVCEEEVEVLQELHHAGLRARVGATCRPVPGDILAAARARADEAFVFVPVSDTRLRAIGWTLEQARSQLRAGSALVLDQGMGLNVIAEDASRADSATILRLFDAIADLSVSRYILCDTVGAATPDRMGNLTGVVVGALGRSATVATHCHNDFGMATANTVASVAAGARCVTCTVNGLGERAGNADLAEVVAALTHLLDVDHSINPLLLAALAARVELYSGVHNSPLKPVVGSNVYSHESGIHVHGILKDPKNYAQLPPRWVGREHSVVLGKHSGLSAVAHTLAERGIGQHGADAAGWLERVKTASRQRSKLAHVAAHAAMVETRRELLGGVADDLFERMASAKVGGSR
jgi:isopropylmalate/homocitrate/citramalate synthase